MCQTLRGAQAQRGEGRDSSFVEEAKREGSAPIHILRPNRKCDNGLEALRAERGVLADMPQPVGPRGV